MKTFEEIKSQWENQPEIEIPNNGSKLIIEKIRLLKNKQQIMNIVLGITAIVLIAFFFYIAAYNNILVAVALLLMIGSLSIRMLIEYFSIKKLKQIKVITDAKAFKQKLIGYYKQRIKIHYIITPILLLIYAIGFLILLPFFKEELSSGFYTYIQISAIVVLVGLVFFIRKQILKELSILKELRN